ncbi:MAG: Phosphoribosyltransferase [Candidatus Gottesmanbacteria bacterium GW2011_GWC2_39_8]|uniref:Phosphoribosyltransferase n=1 Tax=Candidatus Gottesmanbacteria bacterium GW2011_GWC2_39_8 TaxID=1618450 RepID=A0A0G0PW63_9BACT|nr:MAG: Phosphoribosyltransferase [Candidatus Gottesmanbacteria bacterium GW2011_GWC2_39_8]
MIFENRLQAGRLLAEKVAWFGKYKPVVLGLSRGGVPVGYEIAKRLEVPLEIIVVRKIGSPENKEFGIGALAEEHTQIFDEEIIQALRIPLSSVMDIVEEEKKEIKRKIGIYRRGETLPDLSGKAVIITDDGLATGVTAEAAIKEVKKHNPEKILLTCPVGARNTVNDLRKYVDEIVCLITPSDFTSVGIWYRQFGEVTDNEVINLLDHSQRSSDKNHVHNFIPHFIF